MKGRVKVLPSSPCIFQFSSSGKVQVLQQIGVTAKDRDRGLGVWNFFGSDHNSVFVILRLWRISAITENQAMAQE